MKGKLSSSIQMNYLIGQNFVGQNFRRTKYFVGQNFRHQAEISPILSYFYLTFVLKYWTKFSTEKIFCQNFCPIRYLISSEISEIRYPIVPLHYTYISVRQFCKSRTRISSRQSVFYKSKPDLGIFPITFQENFHIKYYRDICTKAMLTNS